MDTTLLDILRCPDEHHAELTYDADAQTLTCTQCRRIFPILDGIPVLLLDEAIDPAAGAPGVEAPAAGTPGAEASETRPESSA